MDLDSSPADVLDPPSRPNAPEIEPPMATPTSAERVWLNPDVRARILDHVEISQLCGVALLSRGTAREVWKRLYAEVWLQDLDMALSETCDLVSEA